MKQGKPAAARSNTVLDDIAAEIGLRATILLAGWWGGCNIVVPASRPEKSRIAQVIGVEEAKRLTAVFGGEQLFIPRLTWLEEIRKARQVHNLRARGFSLKEISGLMVIPMREVENLAEGGRFAAEVIAGEMADRHGGDNLFELEPPHLKSTKGGPAGKPRTNNPAAGKRAA